MEPFEELIKHGIYMSKGNMRIQQVGFIGGSQAILRVFNTKQYNIRFMITPENILLDYMHACCKETMQLFILLNLMKLNLVRKYNLK
jgi:hypothetical protein